MSDQEFADAEVLLRQRLTQLAEYAPTAVRMHDEVAVVSTNRQSGRGRRFGLVVAVTALIGAGGFTTYSFLGASNDGGAATPQEAVSTFVTAMEREDVLGMIDVTLPEEVAVLRAAVGSIASDAKRVDLLDDDFSASGVKGLDISVDDLAFETNFLEGGLAAVTATSGTISASLDPKAFPFGVKVRELVGNGDRVSTASLTLANGDSSLAIMTVERDGRWYVSLEYTIAEYVRQLNGWEPPGPVSRTPVGFDSPEAAATGFYERLASLDLQSTIDTFAPGEDAMAWLAQSWMSDAQAAVERARSNGWSVAVSGLTYEAFGDGSQLTLRPATFHVEGTSSAGYGQASSGTSTSSNEDGTVVQVDFPATTTTEPQSFSVDRADGCTTVTGSLTASLYGSDLPPGATAVDGGFRLCGTGNEILGGLGLLLSGSALQLPAISVVQSGGQWYVSPLGTILGSVTVDLHDIVAGTSLFDTALAPFLYGGLGRGTLELMVKGQSASSIDPACLPALTVDGDVVTGVVADPPRDAIRMCNETVSFTSEGSSSSGSATAPAVAETPASTSEPAATTP